MNYDNYTAPELAGPYVIVDTDQSICYDNQQEIASPAAGENFHGQDAQFDGTQPSYVVSTDGLTVYDEITGLTWVRSPDTNGDGELESPADKLTWAQAQTNELSIHSTHPAQCTWPIQSQANSCLESTLPMVPSATGLLA